MIENKFGFVTFLVAIIGMMGVGWLIRERKPAPPSLPTQAMEPTAV
jgi:hypothetical protein